MSLKAEETSAARHPQKQKATDAIEDAFNPRDKNENVLFYLPITKTWLKQFILALILICHSSYRGVKELLRDLFDYKISITSIHNLIYGYAKPANEINEKQDLSPVKNGLHDEIFQGSKPVITGVDNLSTYCYLLKNVEHRDEDNWGWKG